MGRGPTVGVEEEFLVVDPRTREPAPLGPDVASIARGGEDIQVQLELSPAQVETATGVCADLLDLREQVTRGRRLLADAAAEAGGRLVASGVPPIGDPPTRTSP